MKTFLSLAAAAVILANSPVLEATRPIRHCRLSYLRQDGVHRKRNERRNSAALGLHGDRSLGPLRMAESRDKADVILTISGASSVRLVEASEISPGNLATMYADTSTEPSVPVGFTRISVVDPKTGKALWSRRRKRTFPRAEPFPGWTPRRDGTTGILAQTKVSYAAS